ncbi:hypothetical protein HK407_02g03910 [Ordospora pajunii]|uniref:uncharacterized protein n=1 Tax=Ordospora pajunii TaxID=3039483 RepID=UPI0029526D9A|nr:uncharacterized protein HK407_02g03910 [Ordospora pajunii]KAH9411945.1 hypothetical protein HK407_02g03910 [Ordospora pajunii]
MSNDAECVEHQHMHSDCTHKLQTLVCEQNLNELVLEYLDCEGMGDVAVEFANDVGISFAKSSSLSQRTEIRNEIESGDIDTAISRINDINPEIIDRNTNMYYFLMEHKACELSVQIKNACVADATNDAVPLLEEVIEFIRSELYDLAIGDLCLMAHLEDLLEFVIFDSEESGISKRRKKLAAYVNRQILEIHGAEESKLRSMLAVMVSAEKSLTETHKFPTFAQYFT